MNKIKKLWKDRDNQYTYFKWLIEYSMPFTGRIGLMIFLNLISTVLTMVIVQVSKDIIDKAIIGDEFVWLVAVYILVMLMVQVLAVVSNLFSTLLSEKFSFGIRKQVYEKIINSHWMDVKRYHTGDLMTRLTSDAGNVADGIITVVPSIIQLVIELILVFFTLFFYSPLLAVFALLVAPISAVVSFWLGRKLKRLQLKVQESEASYRSFLQESLANLLVVKSFANEEYSANRLTQLRDERFRWVYKRTKLAQISTTSMSISFQIGYITAFTYGAIQISRQIITYGTMSVFLTLVNRIQSPILQLSQQIPKLVSVLASAGRIMELENIPEEEKVKEHIEAMKIGLEMEHVTFGYTDEIVLEDVSLKVEPGEFLAIVGQSGIGKTTLIRLIMSFMSNLQGRITFYNDKGETEKANAGTREFLAYVPQGNTLFSGTIRENLCMGKHDATDDELYEALKLSSGYEFVMELPQGLDTVIGERGHGLSEGQAQRIAIARAFVRKAPFLILDEATSALDEQTELQVIQGLQQLNPRPTCLIITHRKSILQYCDREIQIQDKHVLL